VRDENMNQAKWLRAFAVAALAIAAMATPTVAGKQPPARDGDLFPATKGTGSLYVVIRDSLESKRLAWACISVWLPKGIWRDSICTDSNHGALFEGLPPGKILVSTFHGGPGAWRSTEIGIGPYFGKRDSVTIVAGRKAKVTLKLRHRPETGSLHVMARDAESGVPVPYARVSTGGSTSRQLSDRGDILMSDLPVGMLALRVSDGSGLYDGCTGSVLIRRDVEETLVVKLHRKPQPQIIVDTEPVPSASITVRLVSAATRHLMPGVAVHLEDAKGLVHAARTDSTGAAEFTVTGDDAMMNEKTDVVRVWTADTLGYERAEVRIRLWGGDTPLVELPLRKKDAQRKRAE
jgi:hypothetical protein